MMHLPMAMTWDGKVLKPCGPRAEAQANNTFVCGQRHLICVYESRSDASHRHEFAWLNEAWKNLPETLADLYPTAEHLRKRALIDAGFYDEQIVDAGSQAAALRVATTFRAREAFSLVITRGPVVVLRTAKSQSRRAMTKQQFQESKTALMETIAAMVGVAPEQLVRHAGQAA